jgi:hypothetical protein
MPLICQENWEGLESKETDQLLVCVCDINLPSGNINIIMKVRNLLDASRGGSLEAYVERVKYIFLFHYQNSEQNYYMKVDDKSLENVEKSR